jgi:hypothetical protein
MVSDELEVVVETRLLEVLVVDDKVSVVEEELEGELVDEDEVTQALLPKISIFDLRNDTDRR